MTTRERIARDIKKLVPGELLYLEHNNRSAFFYDKSPYNIAFLDAGDTLLYLGRQTRFAAPDEFRYFFLSSKLNSIVYAYGDVK